MENRQRILRGVAGAYIIYLGVSLVKGFIQGDPGAEVYMALIGGAFVLLGVGLVVWVAKDILEERKREPHVPQMEDPMESVDQSESAAKEIEEKAEESEEKCEDTQEADSDKPQEKE